MRLIEFRLRFYRLDRVKWVELSWSLSMRVEVIWTVLKVGLIQVKLQSKNTPHRSDRPFFTWPDQIAPQVWPTTKETAEGVWFVGLQMGLHPHWIRLKVLKLECGHGPQKLVVEWATYHFLIDWWGHSPWGLRHQSSQHSKQKCFYWGHVGPWLQ